MPYTKKSYALRVSVINFEKMKTIAELNHRSLNSQIEFLIQECIDAYEKERGEIKPKED